jgi:hypothetical protein
VKHQTGWSPEDSDIPPPISPENRDANPENMSTIGVMEHLLSSGRNYARIEGERQKLRVGIAVSGLRRAAIVTAASLFLLLGLLAALPLAIILILAPYLGPLGATATVFVGGFLVVWLLVIAAKATFRHMLRRIGLGRGTQP